MIAVQKIDSSISIVYLRHDQILTVLDVLILCLDDGLKELDVDHLASMQFNQMHEMLDVLVRDRLAQLNVILQDVAARFDFLFLVTKQRRSMLVCLARSLPPIVEDNR